MFLLGWWICCSLLVQYVSAGDLEISDYDSDDVICSEVGLQSILYTARIN